MGINIVFRQEVVGLISFYKKEGEFTKRELFIMNQLQKHFAYRVFYEIKKVIPDTSTQKVIMKRYAENSASQSAKVNCLNMQ